MLFLVDRRGGLHKLAHGIDETVAQALLRHGIPPTSVLVYRDDTNAVIPDDAVLAPAGLFTARLIEGYDIAGIRQLYTQKPPESTAAQDAPLLKRRLAVAPTGALHMEHHHLDYESAARHVEDTVHDTIERFSLLGPGSSVVLGLSGGVDSGSLLILLAQYRDQCQDSPPAIHAATFRDFDSRYSETFEAAVRLADRFGVDHQVLEAESAQHVFHLDRPIAQILMLLMETNDAHLTMYVDHHTTRRVLEVFADERGTHNVALGLHTTDLLAGLVNSWSTGHEVGPIPARPVGDYRYIFPLAFIPKRELYLYYTARTGKTPTQTTPN